MSKMSFEDFSEDVLQEQKEAICLMGDELSRYREEHQPIADLKPGDTLMLKDPDKYQFPKVGQIVEVYALIPNPEMRFRSYPEGGNHDCDTNDFIAVLKRGDGAHEFIFDSRFFARV